MFDPKLDKGTFFMYSHASKAYRVYKSRTLIVEESIHIYKHHLNNLVWMRSQNMTKQDQAQIALLSELEPKSIGDVLLDEG
ncbi:hypothetical protein CR513_00039, partial [Mucuna pruriens]